MGSNEIQSAVDRLTGSGRKHVALLQGGMSAEREVSMSSGKGVSTALIQNGYQVTVIDVGSDIGAVLHSLRPQLVFNCLHGTYGEDGCIPGLLNLMRIPYTHSGLQASAMAMDKSLSKVIMESAGIRMSPNFLVRKGEKAPLPRPYVIKPLAQGSSIGVQLVFPGDKSGLKEYEFKYGDTVLVEKYVKGRELNIAVLDGIGLGILEIEVINGKRFYDYESKYSTGFTKHLIPPDLSPETTEKILRTAEHAYKALRCRGLARVECILSKEDHEVYLLEVNTHPGMTPLSICPEIALFHGISFNELVERMLATAQCDM